MPDPHPSTHEPPVEPQGGRRTGATGIFTICPCGAKASGTRATHCRSGGCHQTFGGEEGFREHRAGGHCLDPANKGYQLVTRDGWTRWIKPMDEAARERMRGLPK